MAVSVEAVNIGIDIVNGELPPVAIIPPFALAVAVVTLKDAIVTVEVVTLV